MLRKVRYQSRIFRRDAGWKSTGDAGWKYFPPCIKLLFYALKTHLFVHFEGCGFATNISGYFSQCLLTLKRQKPIHHLSTVGPNSSLWARGHVGCWVEFHPASLSEGWVYPKSIPSAHCYLFKTSYDGWEAHWLMQRSCFDLPKLLFNDYAQFHRFTVH